MHNVQDSPAPFKVLELFAGSRSIGKVCDQYGFECRSLDIKPFDNVDIVADLLNWDHLALDYKPDFIWASPPCTSYSVCGIRYHRRNLQPISDFARISDQILIKLHAVLDHFNVPFIVENPMGLMRKMPIMQRWDRRLVTYCRYQDHRMKPTDLWSLHFRSLLRPDGISLRPPCHNSNPFCDHDRQPRSYADRKALGVANKGTSGQNGNYDRSVIPRQLAVEVLLDAYRITHGKPFPVVGTCKACDHLDRKPLITDLHACGRASRPSSLSQNVDPSTVACSFFKSRAC